MHGSSPRAIVTMCIIMTHADNTRRNSYSYWIALSTLATVVTGLCVRWIGIAVARAWWKLLIVRQASGRAQSRHAQETSVTRTEAVRSWTQCNFQL